MRATTSPPPADETRALEAAAGAQPPAPAGEPLGSRKHHLGALTGLRFIAAAAVYYHHLGPPAGAPEFLVTAHWAGYWGVTLFFTLSGFVLAINYFDAMREPSLRKTWSFAVARFARVYPLYLVVFLYWTAKVHIPDGKLGVWFEHLLTVQAWEPNMEAAFAYNGPAWSVGVETFLYATFPLFVPLVVRVDRSVRSLVVAAALVAAAIGGLAAWFIVTGRADFPLPDPRSAHRWLYRTPLLRIGDFALGILAARLYVRIRSHEGMARLGGNLAFAALAVFVLLMTQKAFIFTSFSWDAGYALPSVAIILGLALSPGDVLARTLSARPLILLGEASYAFYLVHWACLGLLGPTWVKDANRWTIALTAFNFAGILALSIGLHFVVERPARAWLRRVLG